MKQISKIPKAIIIGFIFLIIPFFSFAEKTIYVTSRWKQMNRIETIGFSLGYDIKYLKGNLAYELDNVAKELSSLSPEDSSIIIICDDDKEFKDIAIKISNFVNHGGKVFWMISGLYLKSGNSMNDILKNKFNMMIDTKMLFYGEGSYNGKDLTSLWKDLFVGVPDAVNQGIENSIVVRDRELIDATITSEDKEYITSVKMKKENGEIWFVCTPFYDYGGSSEPNKSIFSDDSIELYENLEALNRVCRWLVE